MKKAISVRIGFLFTLLSILVPIGIAYFESTENELTVEWVSTDNLVSDTEQGTGLKVFFDEQLVEAPKLIRLQIKNSGTEPISKSDFDTPLQLKFAQGATLLKAIITSTVPTSIPAEVSLESDSIELKPLLLNPEDTINVSIIISGTIDNLEVFGRIANIQSLDLIKHESEKNQASKYVIVIATSVFLGFIYVYFINATLCLKVVPIPRWIGFPCALSSAVAVSFLLRSLLYSDSSDSLYVYIASASGAILFGFCIFSFLNSRKSSCPN
ncbi:hypothetical protein AB4605_21215 [Vibrio cyclitrophicus]